MKPFCQKAALAPVVIVAILMLVNVGVRMINDASGVPYTAVDPRLIEAGITIAVLAAFWNLYRQIQADARQAKDREATSEYREQRLANDVRIIKALRRIEAKLR